MICMSHSSKVQMHGGLQGGGGEGREFISFEFDTLLSAVYCKMYQADKFLLKFHLYFLLPFLSPPLKFLHQALLSFVVIKMMSYTVESWYFTTVFINFF